VVFAGLVAVPVAAFAADPAVPAGIPVTAVTVSDDPDGAGELFTLTEDFSTTQTITMPNNATLDAAGHTITAVEDATHPNFPGAVLASAVGDNAAPAELDVKNLDITTQGFASGSNSGGLLTGISMYRAGGSLTNVTVNGISHGNGVQEGNGISIRNRVAGDDINVPRAHVVLSDVEVTNFQKTGLLLDGNLTFAVSHATLGQGAGPQGQANPVIAANSLQISRGASGSVIDSIVKLNSHAQATGALLYNAHKVDFDRVTIDGAASATTGINISNVANTIDTVFTMRGGAITRTAAPAAGTGLAVDGPANAITATVIDTPIVGWSTATSGNVAVTQTPVTPAVTKVNVTGDFKATRKHDRRLRVDFQAFPLAANQAEGNLLRWMVKVDGKRVMTVGQHAGDTDTWAQRFRKGTGTHTVEIFKNGVSQHIYKVRTH
jgi:hypothetical protein